MQINYDAIAKFYDEHRRGDGPYLDTLARLATSTNARRVLELGSGTGNNTEAFLKTCPCFLIGLEPSRGMLARAQQKRLSAHWVQGSAVAIPLSDASVDFVFACFVIHHLPDLDPLTRECRRVLTGRGAVAFVTAPHDFIERHPMNRYFPSFAAIDKARFPPVDQIMATLRQAGFPESGCERSAAAPVAIDHAYLRKVAARFISTYALLPEDEFQNGLAQLRSELETKSRLETDITWECAVVWGRRNP